MHPGYELISSPGLTNGPGSMCIHAFINKHCFLAATAAAVFNSYIDVFIYQSCDSSVSRQEGQWCPSWLTRHCQKSMTPLLCSELFWKFFFNNKWKKRRMKKKELAVRKWLGWGCSSVCSLWENHQVFWREGKKKLVAAAVKCEGGRGGVEEGEGGVGGVIFAVTGYQMQHRT